MNPRQIKDHRVNLIPMTKEQAATKLGVKAPQVMRLARRLEIAGQLEWAAGPGPRRAVLFLTQDEVKRIGALQHKLRAERLEKVGRKPNPPATRGKRLKKGANDDDGNGGHSG